MLTSIVMVSFHTGSVLLDALAGVLAQTGDLELILVDNGNPADVFSRLRALAAEDTRLSLVSGHGNVGFGAACNLGARHAKGDVLLFLNPDSLLPPLVLHKLAHYHSLLARPYMIGARLLDENGRDQRGCRRALLTPMTALIEATHLYHFFPSLRLNFSDEPVPVAIEPIPAISGAFMALPTKDFWRIDGFDEGYFLHVEDLDLCFRFRQAGGEIYFAPDIVVTHVGSTSQATTAFIEKHKAHGFIRYFRRNFSTPLNAPLLGLLGVLVWVRTWAKILAAGMKGRAPLSKNRSI